MRAIVVSLMLVTAIGCDSTSSESLGNEEPQPGTGGVGGDTAAAGGDGGVAGASMAGSTSVPSAGAAGLGGTAGLRGTAGLGGTAGVAGAAGSAGAAEPTCLDEDMDGYGEGDGCLGPDCRDDLPDVNPGAVELCNERDDRCTGEVDSGLGDLTPAMSEGPPEIMSLHLNDSSSSIFGVSSWTVQSVLQALKRVLEQRDLALVESQLGASAASGPRLSSGDVCLLLTDIEYLLNVFPQADDVLDDDVAVDTKCFVDAFGFSFCTPEQELFTPLPFDRDAEHVLYPGAGTAADDLESPELQLEIVVRQRRHLVRVAPTVQAL